MLVLRKVKPFEIRTRWADVLGEFFSGGDDIMEIVNWSDHYKNIISAYYTARKAIVNNGYEDSVEAVKDDQRLFLHRKG